MLNHKFFFARIIPVLMTIAVLAAGAVALNLPATGVAVAEDKIKQGESVADVASLLAEGELKDIVEGDPKAPVTIIEYSSLTCGHCAQFHKTVLPELRKKYIDTGKVRYILREFPLDNLAVAGFMLARCDQGKFTHIIEDLYAHQDAWAFVPNPFDKLKERAKTLGFTDDSFMACVRDQALLDKIVKVHDKASREFNVDSTPTLFVNGKMLRGPSQLAQLEQLMGDVAKK